MKTKKKVLTVAATIGAALMLTAGGMISTGKWEKVSDSDCDKCSITDTGYTCGKCKSAMDPGEPDYNAKTKYLTYTFTCKDANKKGCTHSCIYKCKSF